MIHTMDIYYVSVVDEVTPLLEEYANCCTDLKLKERVTKFTQNLTRQNDRSSLRIPTDIYGLRHIAFYHNAETNGYAVFISVVIDLQSLVLQNITNELFAPSYDSAISLCLAFGSAITTVFPFLTYSNEDNQTFADLPYLMKWKVRRLEYALNLRCDNKELALQLINKSYTDARKTPTKFDDNYNLQAKSKAKRRSSITTIYDKSLRYENEVNEHHKDVPKALIEEAKDILRYEYKRTSLDIKWIQSNYPSIPQSFFHSDYWRSPITFLDADACRRILLSEYTHHIGLGDWKNDYFHTLTIKESSLKTSQKNKMLKEFSPLISQSRSIKAAKGNYTEKNYTVRGKRIHGTAATFKKYIDLYASINLHPLRIPDRIAKSYHINTVSNPINNIIKTHLCFYPYCIINYRISNTLSKDISAIFDSIWDSLGRQSPYKTMVYLKFPM